MTKQIFCTILLLKNVLKYSCIISNNFDFTEYYFVSSYGDKYETKETTFKRVLKNKFQTKTPAALCTL